MPSTEQKLKELLNVFGNEVVNDRRPINVFSQSCIDEHVPSAPGVYWIETTMPLEEVQSAIFQVIGKEKRSRKRPSEGTNLIEQGGRSQYVVYSGIEKDLKKGVNSICSTLVTSTLSNSVVSFPKSLFLTKSGTFGSRKSLAMSYDTR